MLGSAGGCPVDEGTCCDKDNRCDIGEGDCDSDSDCADGLKCGTDNCHAMARLARNLNSQDAFDSSDDCCIKDGNEGTQ